MLFQSLDFLLFFPIVAGAFFLLPHYCQRYLLLAASYFFYGYWDWKLLPLILLSTLVDYVAGLRIGSLPDGRRRTLWLWASITINLGLLGLFKYANFFVSSFVMAFDLDARNAWLSHIVLPVGISFYTFQTLSYTIDVFRRRIEPERDPVLFALFVAYFPQLVAGPIERAGTLLPQLAKPGRFDAVRLREGLWLMLWGFFKKLAVGDTLSVYLESYRQSPAAWSPLAGMLFCFLAGVMVYADFSGYTDIARGSARIMGVDLSRNFHRPFAAGNIAELWSRWHTTLVEWMRDYLYNPLLKPSRPGKLRLWGSFVALLSIIGLWHGADWKFVIWGAANGSVFVLSNVLKRPWRRLLDRLGTLGRAVRRPLGIFLTIFAFVFPSPLFYCQSVGEAMDVYAAIYSFSSGQSWLKFPAGLLKTLECLALVALMFALEAGLDPSAPEARSFAIAPERRVLLAYGLALLISLYGFQYAPKAFVYFQF